MPIVIDDPATLDALREKGCLGADNTVDRDALAAVLAVELEANHVAHSLDEVYTATVAPGQLTVDIFGVTDPGLSKVVSGLLSPSLAGKVQTALANGYVLCATRSKVVVELVGGEQKTVTVSTRFLTDDHDMIDEYFLNPASRRAEGTVKRTVKLGAMVKARQPEMAARVDEWAGQLQITFQTALTAGSGS